MNKPFTRPRTGPMRFPGDIPNTHGGYATQDTLTTPDVPIRGKLRDPIQPPQVAILAEDLRPLLECVTRAAGCFLRDDRPGATRAMSALLDEATRIERGIK